MDFCLYFFERVCVLVVGVFQQLVQELQNKLEVNFIVDTSYRLGEL